MINFDDVTKESIEEHNSNWPQIPHHPYRILIVGGSGSGKTNPLFNLISQQLHIHKICLYAKDPYKAKHQFKINKKGSTDLKHLNDLKLLLNTRMIWMIFIKISKNRIQIKNVKY